MKSKIIGFLLSKSGSIVKIPVGLAVGYIANLLTGIGYELTPKEQAAVIGAVTAIIVAGLDTWVNKNVTDNVKQIQTIVGTKVDGVPLEKTTEAVKEINRDKDHAEKLLRRGGRGL